MSSLMSSLPIYANSETEMPQRRGERPTEFRERLAYARWVRQLSRRDADSDREFAERANVGYDWLQKWKKREDAPQERKLVRNLCSHLGCSEDWLIDNEGEPPRPELYAEWLAAYRWTARAGAEPVRPAYDLNKEKAVVAEDPRPKKASKRRKSS